MSSPWCLAWAGIVLLVAGKAAPAADTVPKEQRETQAANDRYRVVLIARSDGNLRLEVLERHGKLLWQTQPSSTLIRIALDRNRIVVFNKTQNQGKVDEGRPGPTRGATMFTLAGEKVGDLPPSVHDGAFAGPLFLARKVGRGVIAYDLDAAKEIWQNAEVNADRVSLAGPGLLNLRWYNGREKRFDNYLLSSESGKVVQQISSPRDEDAKVLAASGEQYLTLRTVPEAGGAARWQSELLDKEGRKIASIRWQGMPIEAAFSPDGAKLAAICASPVRESGGKQMQYLLETYAHDGKPLERSHLLTADADAQLEASIVFDSDSVRASVTRTVEVRLKESSR